MNRLAPSRSNIGSKLAAMLPVALAACGTQAGRAAFSDSALTIFSRDRVAQEAPVEVRRMLSGDAFNFYAMAPSPDGRYVTEILWNTGDLAVRSLATGETRRVTNNLNGSNGAYPDGSIFSPDGSRLAYVWQAFPDETSPTWRWELRTIGLDGTDMRVHLGFDDNEAYPEPEDWSKDGRYILTTLAHRVDAEVSNLNDSNMQLATVDVATNEVRVLKTLGKSRWPSGAFFSPDGRFVAYDLRAAPDSREHDIFLVSSDGSRETTLIRTPDHEELLGWLPDGSGILFHRSAEDSRAIWKLPLRDGQPSGPPELVRDDVSDMTGFGFSDDAYYYGVTVSRPGVHTASFDLGTGRVLEALEPLADPPGLASDGATWSPDGTRIVYASAERGRNGQRRSRIIVRSLTGEILQDIPLALEQHGRFGWTAHGLVTLGRSSGQEGLFLISLETGQARYLKSSWDPLFTVSPDGAKIFLGAPGGPIIEYEIATGRERVLVERHGYTQVTFPDAPAGSWFGGVSPDGNKIVYQVSRDGGRGATDGLEIFSRSTGESRVIGGLAWVYAATWSPDSRYVLLEGRLEERGDYHLLRISAEDGSMRSLAHGPRRFKRPRVSPDGRHVSVTIGEDRLEIWRMTFNRRH